MVTMNVGDKVPDLLGLDADGNEIRLSNYPGKKIVLYFYPKDSTPGCTAEACSMRDNISALNQEGYQLIGVSTDSAESHKKFAAKNNLRAHSLKISGCRGRWIGMDLDSDRKEHTEVCDCRSGSKDAQASETEVTFPITSNYKSDFHSLIQ